MQVLALDPSGSFFEGKGHTGWALFETDCDKQHDLKDFGCIEAAKFASLPDYYHAIAKLIQPGMVVVMEDFMLYANQAKSQINSRMETSKLIGYVQMYCYDHGNKVCMQTAAEVKKRWANYILEHKGYLRRVSGTSLQLWNALGRLTNDHERDAIRHGVHFCVFKSKKERYKKCPIIPT